jgi:hypothetical protein
MSLFEAFGQTVEGIRTVHDGSQADTTLIDVEILNSYGSTE